MSDYPMCEKLSGVMDDVRTLYDFLEWAQQNGMLLCTLMDTGRVGPGNYPIEHYFPVGKSYESVIQEFFEIDPKRLETERRAMLADLQSLSE